MAQFDVEWHGDRPAADVVRQTEGEIQELLDDGLKGAESLMMHTVILDKPLEGPVVLVWGVEGDTRFHAEYVENPDWSGPS